MRHAARPRAALLWSVLAMLAMLAHAGAAHAGALAGPWRLSVRPAPSYLPPSGEAKLILSATNMGNASTSGPITITDRLPASMPATAILAHGELEARSSLCRRAAELGARTELHTLPEGPHSALTSNVPESKKFSLCGSRLAMPTTITAQNGAVIETQTKIPVLGCGAVKAYSRSQLLGKALTKCRKQFKHAKRKRAGCEAKARKHYGAGQKKGQRAHRGV